MRRGPGSGPAAQAFEERTGVKAPRIIAWEITRSCNLACAHCRAASHFDPYPGELTLEECKAVIDDIASITDPILILTGGEPLMRDDIWDIVDYAQAKGLRSVIGTNGTLRGLRIQGGLRRMQGPGPRRNGELPCRGALLRLRSKNRRA